MNKTWPVILVLALALSACGQRQSAPVSYRSFPKVQVPAMVTQQSEAVSYIAEHFWDPYFATQGVTDSAAILGVRKLEVEQALADYLAVLDRIPLSDAQKQMDRLFSKVEACQAADTASLFYLRFTEMVEKYLYDPNSPLRNEDLFLPFVRKLADCPYTDSLMHTGYAYEAKMCALTPAGSIAPDFQFKDIRGKVHSLHGTKAQYTMLFFSNPFCEACKEMIDDIDGSVVVSLAIEEGTVAVVNVYIDEEIGRWKAYEPTYPRSWITGYDWKYEIRTDQSYNVRAIPSLYLLAEDKTVIMKDAPTDRVLRYLENKLTKN